MRAIQLTLQQAILNKANSMTDFTYYLKESSKKNRYIVSISEIYKGPNPSLQSNLLTEINKAVSNANFDSIGGWHNKEENVYCLDANIHFNDIVKAKILAAANLQVAIYDDFENKVIYIND